MAKIVSFFTQKGGTGKSTCTILAAAALAQPPHSQRVFVADCDPQQSVIRRRLADQQATSEVPPYTVQYLTLPEIQANIARLDKEHDLVFIDLPGRLDAQRPTDQQEITKFLMYVDRLFVPLVPGNFNVQATADFLRIVRKMADARQATAAPLQIVCYLNMYEGGRTADDKLLMQEAHTLATLAGVQLMATPLNRYAAYRSADTYNTLYTTADRTGANFSSWLDELKQHL